MTTMFYSQSLLSRNGPLGTIWVAAYCLRKLRKDQVAQTDICSSIDKIMVAEVSLAYRVLAHLLLGVVRIYSKKVDYLRDDCNEALIRLKNSVSFRKINQPKETMRARHSSITLPEKFELDAFNLEDLEELQGGHVDHPGPGTLQEQEDEKNWPYSLNQGYHKEMDSHNEFHSSRFTLEEDVLLPDTMDIDLVISELYNLSGLETSGEKLQGIELTEEESHPQGMFCEQEEPLDLSKCFGKQDTHVEQIKSQERLVDTELNKLSGLEATGNRLQGSQPPEEESRDQEMFCEQEEPLDPSKCFGKQDTYVEKIKLQERLSLDLGKSYVNTEGYPITITLTETTGAATPEFLILRTPMSKEPDRKPRKRKKVFDETVVLPSEVLRQGIHDASSLVSKRNKLPHTSLGVWKAYKISNLEISFLEPLIPCTSFDVKSLFQKREFEGRGPIKSDEEEFKTPSKSSARKALFGKDYVDPSVPMESAERPSKPDDTSSPKALFEKDYDPSVPIESAEAPSMSDKVGSETPRMSLENKSLQEENVFEPSVSVGVLQSSTTANSNGVEFKTSIETTEEEPSAIEIPDFCLNLMDEKNGSQKEVDQNLDGWSIRTRAVAQHCWSSFRNQKERKEKGVLNLARILGGKTKTTSARLFCEVLVLKSKGYIDVQQDSPYGDILLLRTPQIEAMFGNQ